MDDLNAPPAPLPLDDPARRRFFGKLGAICGSIVGFIVAIPSIVFLLGLRKASQEWRSLGSADLFRVGETKLVSFLDPSPLPWAGVTARTAAWLRREDDGTFIAFSVNCTHLGCPVRWLPGAKLFMCPCHGGVYFGNGAVASGPPPAPLPTYPVRLRDGNVEILTTPLPISGK
ncbi:MAG TPA: Rieske 2Fe-2S domain-containing protein [Candidatus Acidoferrales bacterium]|nr:Rieske 2Fe-2S domain-containing protein [Candidatus Acidoferrales bacterium]